MSWAPAWGSQQPAGAVPLSPAWDFTGGVQDSSWELPRRKHLYHGEHWGRQRAGLRSPLKRSVSRWGVLGLY